MNALSFPGFFRCLRVNPAACCASQGSAVVRLSVFGWYLRRNGGFPPREKSGSVLGSTSQRMVSVRGVGSESSLQLHPQPIGLLELPPFPQGANTGSGDPVVAFSVIVALASQ